MAQSTEEIRDPATPAAVMVRWALGVGLVIATFVAYTPALQSGFVWDDDEYLTNNVDVQNPGGLLNIWAIRLDPETGKVRFSGPQYYPLVFTSFWIEYRIWGLNAGGYHAVNVLLHAINALLLWAILRRLKIPGAWCAAAFFALHPAHVESVAWITERKNVLSGLFYLLALSAFLRFHDRRRWGWYAAALAAFVAALLSKTVTCSLPVVILLVIWYQSRRITLRDLAATAPMFVLGLAAGLLTAYLESTQVAAGTRDWGVTLMERVLLIAPRAFLFYAMKVLWPHPVSFIYPRWGVHAELWTSYLPLIGLVAISVAAAAAVRRVGWGPLLLLLYSGVTLFPALGFFEVYFNRFSWVADHFNYLGSLGFIVLYASGAIWLGQRSFPGRTLAVAGRIVAVLLLVALAALTFKQSGSYENADRLWRDTLKKNPGAWIASLNLGINASQNGRHDEAVRYFEYTTRFKPVRAEALNSWGMALLRVGDGRGAILKARQALDLDPDNAKHHALLGTAYMNSGDFAAARPELERAVALNPEHPYAWSNLAVVQMNAGEWREAEQSLLRAIDLNPTDQRLRDLLRQVREHLGKP